MHTFTIDESLIGNKCRNAALFNHFLDFWHHHHHLPLNHPSGLRTFAPTWVTAGELWLRYVQILHSQTSHLNTTLEAHHPNPYPPLAFCQDVAYCQILPLTYKRCSYKLPHHHHRYTGCSGCVSAPIRQRNGYSDVFFFLLRGAFNDEVKAREPSSSSSQWQESHIIVWSQKTIKQGR